jgi:Tfp pilus assembly protein PilF
MRRAHGTARPLGARCGPFLGPAMATLLACAGCARQEGVVRVVDGRPITGAFVPAEAYAAYLRAAIADEGGDLAGAIEGYAVASALGPDDPEPWARLGDARCRRDPRDPRAEEAFSRALSIDAAYSPALESRASCAGRRGEARAAVESARRAVRADPSAAAPLGTLAGLEVPPSEELRVRLVAMTLVAGTDAAAWDALGAWARGHADAALEARALGRLAELAPSRDAEIDAAALRLAGDGYTAPARSLARARIEASGRGEVPPSIARLAIDGALLAGDTDGARRIATRSHVAATVVAARALLLGDAGTARDLAAPVARAEPRALGARLVLAAAAAAERDAAGVRRALSSSEGGDGPIPAEAWLAYGRTLAREGSPDAVRAVFGACAREPLAPADPLTTPLAVALAAAGALDGSELDANGRIELAERRAELAPADVIRGADPRHRLLALARLAPLDRETLALARRLAPARARDPIVAVAFARLALAGAADAPPMAPLLARFDPADPLIAAAALDCAVRAGDTRAIPLARARLAAVAHTPAERARAVE